MSIPEDGAFKCPKCGGKGILITFENKYTDSITEIWVESGVPKTNFTLPKIEALECWTNNNGEICHTFIYHSYARPQWKEVESKPKKDLLSEIGSQDVEFLKELLKRMGG